MIEYDGEDEAYDGDELAAALPFYRRRRFITGLLVMALGLSTTFAANISLNNGKKQEFGQGLYLIKACDQWINVRLVQGAVTSTDKQGWPSLADGSDTPTYTAGTVSPVTQIILSGLDTVKCRATNIKLQIYRGNYAQPVPLFTDAAGTCNRAIFSIPNNATTTLSDRAVNINFINCSGAIVGSPSWNDGYETLYRSGTNAIYTLVLAQPLAYVPDVTRITFESSPNV